MAHQELVDFIKSQVERGVGANDVHNALLQNGWEAADVNEAMSAAGVQAPGAAPAMSAPQEPAQMTQPMITQPMAQPGMDPMQTAGTQGPVDMFDAVDNPAVGAQPAQQGQIAQFGQQIGQQVGQALRSPIDTTMNATKAVAGTAMQAAEDVKTAVEDQMPGLFNNPSITAEGRPLAAGSTIEPDGKLSDGSSSNIEVKEGLGTMARIMVFTLIILGIVAIGGGAVWGYYYITKSPERVAQLFTNGVTGSQAMAFTGSVTENGTELYSFTGAIDTVAPAMQIQLTTTQQQADLQYGMKMLAVDEQLYGSFHSDLDNENAELADSWMILDGQSAASLISSVLPVTGTISTQMELPVTEADRQAFATALQTYPFITGFIKGERTTSNGNSAITYTATIDGAQLKMFTDSVERELRTAGLSSTLVGRMMASQNPYDGAQVELVMDNQSYELYELTITQSNGRALHMTFSQFNQQIVAPENIVTAEEMFSLLLDTGESEETAEEEGAESEEETEEPAEETSETETEPTEETEEEPVEEETPEEPEEEPEVEEEPEESEPDPEEIDTDGDGLSDADEDRYGTNPTRPDTDNDGYLDGEEVENGYNPLGSGKLEE